MADRVWEELSRALRSSAPYKSLLQGLGDVVRLPVPAAAWVGELLARDLGRQLLVVVPREADALAWIEAARLFGSEEGVVYFPAPSLTPYQEAETSLLVRAQESSAIDRSASGQVSTIVATPRALFRRLPRKEDFADSAFDIRPGEDHPLEDLTERLVRFGFRRTDLVYEVGDFAVRGGLVDLHPPGEESPVRLDFFGDTVESIRWFDAHSQRSEDTLDSVRVLPLCLFPCGPREARQLADLIAGGLSDLDMGPEAVELLESLRTRGSFPGWEHYLPLLAAGTVDLPELLDDPLVLAVDPPALESEVAHHADRLQVDFEARRAHRKLALPPEDLEVPEDRVREMLEGAEVRLGDLVVSGASGATGARGTAADFHATLTDLFHGQLPRFPQEVATARARGERCLVVVSPAHRRRIEELLEGRELTLGRGGVELVTGELGRGFRLPAAGVAVYGEQQLLPQARAQRRASPRTRYGPFVSSLRDLRVGDYVVHSDHGIGQFVALRSVGGDGDGTSYLPPVLREGASTNGAGETEVMEISYSGGKRLLLPLSRLDLIQKYSGIEGIAPRLDQLGGTSWNKTKARVKSGMRDMAGELLKLYAERQIAQAPAMPPDSDLLHQFEAAFPYEETPDQLEAIAVIKEDPQRERPMDRLLCGDVGYGKTEVAMRAAFKAVDGGHQVAV